MIRKYRDSDIEALLKVWFEASSLAHPFLNPAFMKKEKENIRNVYIPNTDTWVFSNTRGLIGFISMMGNEIGALFVRTPKQGQGIGRSLVDFVGQFHSELMVEVFKENHIGRAFYDKYGFKTIKEYVHPETQRKLLRMKFTRPAE